MSLTQISVYLLFSELASETFFWFELDASKQIVVVCAMSFREKENKATSVFQGTGLGVTLAEPSF